MYSIAAVTALPETETEAADRLLPEMMPFGRDGEDLRIGRHRTKTDLPLFYLFRASFPFGFVWVLPHAAPFAAAADGAA